MQFKKCPYKVNKAIIILNLPHLPYFSFASFKIFPQKNFMINAALVLEGGSFRTLYTSGILDVFLENGIEFACVIGVSAGALNATNYIAKHVGRSAKINIGHSQDHRFFGIRQFMFKKSAFNFGYLFDEMPLLYPFDTEAIAKTKQRFLIAVTNCDTGKVEYFEPKENKEMFHILKASSSVPFLCPPVKIGDTNYLDGAIAEPIGIDKAVAEGYKKKVVILTKKLGYMAGKVNKGERFFIKLRHKYPNFLQTFCARPQIYNSNLNTVRELEKKGDAFVFRPTNEFSVGSLERNARRMFNLYQHGREHAIELLPAMREYLGNEANEK